MRTIVDGFLELVHGIGDLAVFLGHRHENEDLQHLAEHEREVIGLFAQIQSGVKARPAVQRRYGH